MYQFEAPSTARVIREAEALVIQWDDGETGVFSHAWLWENAPENRYFSGGARAYAAPGFQEPGSPWSVSVEYDETLVISWAGLREVSRYSLDDLRDSVMAFAGPELALAAD
ncbi:MAG: hypothetical protein OXN21_13585 [Chloroflexota bacterium]|nr:hypothetical protein [Chloroflexota bacterium]